MQVKQKDKDHITIEQPAKTLYDIPVDLNTVQLPWVLVAGHHVLP